MVTLVVVGDQVVVDVELLEAQEPQDKVILEELGVIMVVLVAEALVQWEETQLLYQHLELMEEQELLQV